MKKLLMLVAVSEALTGLVLLVYPPIVVRLLFGSVIAGAGVLMSQLTGLGLIALGVACWPDRDPLRASLGMLTWSIFAMFYLVYAGIDRGAGILLWPAVAAHAGIALLLIRAWRKERHAPAKAA